VKIEFFRHNLNQDDFDSTQKVLQSIFLTTGHVVKEFEDKLASYLSCRNVIGVTSCTAALHLTLLAWGIGEGDEVITTPMSFCATSNAILHTGATPVFVDVEEETGNIHADRIETRITEKTKAILPVHLYGQMCDMKKIRRLADRHGLAVIEDAAHCIEGRRDGVRVGELGDAACFSFYATKNLTSGEGGAIATNDPKKAEVLAMLRMHGIDKSATDRYTRKYKHWDMPLLGWKYNMDNIHASLLVHQIDRLDGYWQRRDDIWNRYEKALRGARGGEILKTLSGVKHARHLFTIIVAPEKRDALLWTLQDRGIGVAVNYRAIHLLKYYREQFGYREGDFPAAERIGAGTISLPLYPSLKDDELSYVIRTVIEALKG
jgi:dTDP-4-amino-4,6-dideoxygalactose transaminase